MLDDNTRAEHPPACDHHWVSRGQDSPDLHWIIQCSHCEAFNAAEINRQLAATKRRAARAAWSEAVAEAASLGWLHEDAVRDLIARDPYGEAK